MNQGDYQYYATMADVWYNAYFYWLTAGQIVGAFLVVGSIAVASAPPFLTRFIETKTLAFFVAAVAAINTLIDPMGRAQAYSGALTDLQIALDDALFVRNSPDDFTKAMSNVKKAADSGLEVIRHKAVEPRPQGPDATPNATAR
jgi:hypothetical protein